MRPSTFFMWSASRPGITLRDRISGGLPLSTAHARVYTAERYLKNGDSRTQYASQSLHEGASVFPAGEGVSCVFLL